MDKDTQDVIITTMTSKKIALYTIKQNQKTERPLSKTYLYNQMRSDKWKQNWNKGMYQLEISVTDLQ